MNPLNTVIGYVAGILLVVCIALGVYCKILHEENATLTAQKAQVVSVNKEQSTDLTVCSKATDAVAKADNTLTANAVVAVNEAKKEAAPDYAASKAVVVRKPKVIPPTTTASLPAVTAEQVDDYLQTQDLMNEYINNRAAKDMK